MLTTRSQHKVNLLMWCWVERGSWDFWQWSSWLAFSDLTLKYIYSYLAQLIQSLLWLPVLSGKFSSIGYTSGSCQMTCFLKVLLKALSPWSLGDGICLSLDQHRWNGLIWGQLKGRVEGRPGEYWPTQQPLKSRSRQPWKTAVSWLVWPLEN